MEAIVSFPNAEIPSIFKFASRTNAFLGSRLLNNGYAKGPISKFWKWSLFFVILVEYGLTIAILVSVVFPTPYEPESHFAIDDIILDIRTVFPAMLTCLALDGFGQFVFMNFAFRSLIRPGGFYEKFSKSFYAARLDDKFVKKWKRFVIFSVGLAVEITLQRLFFLGLSALDVINMPIVLSRSVHWLHLPKRILYIILIIAAVFSTLQVAAHLISYSIKCEIVRFRFRFLCERLKLETAQSFHQRRIDSYHGEYKHLARVVEALDDAYKHSLFLQFSILGVAVCFSLMFFTKGDNTVTAWCYIGLSLLATLGTFAYIVLPAILLRAETRKPCPLLYSWFIQYQERMEIMDGGMHEPSRQALALFIQSLLADNVGITAAGLFFLDGRVIMTMASAIGTYFLFILQFGGSNSAPGFGCSVPKNVTM